MNKRKSILITGASSGVGRYAAKILSDRGRIVWAGYRNKNIFEELKNINPKLIIPVILDVTKQKDIDAVYKEILDSGRGLDALMNNAGIGLGGPIEMLDIEEVKGVYDVNFFAMLNLVRIFLPVLRKSQGRIINVGSIGGLVAMPFMMPYSSSKAAIKSMTYSLRRELFGQNVKVSLLELGPLKTNIWKRSFLASEHNMGPQKGIAKFYKKPISKIKYLLNNINLFAKPLKKCKTAIIHSVESNNPRIRYLIKKNDFFEKVVFALKSDVLIDFVLKKWWYR